MTHSHHPTTALLSRRSRFRWVRSALGGLLVLIIAAAGIGFVYQTIARERDKDRYPPPGQLVDAGDYRLHVHVMGEQHDGPTVLLEHGGGSFSSQWGWIQPQVAEFARVVSYDRPGLGWSDSGPDSPDPAQAAAALRTALTEAGIEGPYVIAGHSMGGMLARTFAQIHPDEVVGLVLIDPRPSSWDYVYPDGAEVNEMMFRLIGVAARFGFMRVTGFADDVVEDLPPQQANEAIARMSTRSFFEGMIRDGRLGDSAGEMLAANESMGDLPVIVLSAEEPNDTFDADERERFTDTHAEIATYSLQGEHRIIAGADHFTIVTQQERATEATQAIHDILMALDGQE
jgi:pimeloyl-ACP methyl ester carboxylesterase